MNRLIQARKNLLRRKNRVRSNILGTTERPRLSVYISNMHVTAQVIDDSKQVTLAFVSTVGEKADKAKTMTEKAEWVGGEIAKKCRTIKISKLALDRNGRKYHGRIKALAESVRAGGMEF